MEHTSTFSEEARQLLREAGWRPGRVIGTSQWEVELAADGFPPLHPAAQQFLAEYGGITFHHEVPGATRAREPFELIPTACLGEADRFREWSEYVKSNLAPIGELASGTCAYAFLGIDERREIYVVIDRLATFGRMPLAMDNLVLGYMPREID